jgi:hypothetical protein
MKNKYIVTKVQDSQEGLELTHLNYVYAADHNLFEENINTYRKE